MELETIASVESESGPPEPSLADHEAEFHAPRESARPVAEGSSTESGSASNAPEAEGSASGERDGSTGRFTKAKSQKARVSDVDTISALTKKYHDALAEVGLDLAQDEGESNRVFELRKRAAVAEALRDAKKAPAAPAALSRPAPSSPSGPNGGDSGALTLPANFPAKPKPDDFNDYTEFVEELSAWRAKKEYTLARLADDQRQQSEAFATGVRTRYTEAQQRYQDFKAVVLDPQTTPIPRDSTIEKWTLKHKYGPDVVYHFFKHPDEIAAIHAIPDRDEQIAELTLLGQRLTAPFTRAAVPTRSPAPSVPTPVVKPPNLVRTGAIRTGDELPGEDASLAEHERAFHKKRSR